MGCAIASPELKEVIEPSSPQSVKRTGSCVLF